VRLAVILLLAVLPAADAYGQSAFGRRLAACQCARSGSDAKKPRLLLPVAGGLGFLPVAMASRDSLAPLGLPSLVDIRDNGDNGPRNTLQGQRELAVGALAPDTATTLPTLMVVAAFLLGVGACLMVPRRRRQAWAFWRSRSGRVRGGWRLRTIYRRRIGATVAALGGLLLTLGSREYAEGAEAQRRARAEWLQVGSTVTRIDAGASDAAPSGVAPSGVSGMADLDVPRAAARPAPNAGVTSIVPLPDLARSGREIRQGAPVARLVIPAIDLDEIVVEGVGPVELNGGPGHFPGSVLPGEAGNAIVSAHRDRHFRRVGELGVGSRIRTETRSGTVEWVITERRIVSRDTPSLFEESAPTLTLTTCWPLRYFGPAPDRLLIIAKPAD
jgi:sortase A